MPGLDSSQTPHISEIARVPISLVCRANASGLFSKPSTFDLRQIPLLTLTHAKLEATHSSFSG